MWIKKQTVITLLFGMLTFIIGGVSTAVVFGATGLIQRLAGRILLQVESKGEAWYVDPVTSTRYYLGRASHCFDIMREKGLGITNANLSQIPIAGDSKIPELTQKWKTYNQNFADPVSGMKEISFNYHPNLSILSEGYIPDDCINCTTTTIFAASTPDAQFAGNFRLEITQSQQPLNIDTVNYEYQLAKSTTNNSLETVKIVPREEDMNPIHLQAITPELGKFRKMYYKFEATFSGRENEEQAKRIFQEILNSVRFK